MRLIDADALIDDLEGVCLYDPAMARNAIKRVIRRQPTIEPDSDTISRKAAIDLIERYCDNGCEIAEDKWCPDCQQSKFAEMIKALPPSPSRLQWIPCSERLPDEHKSVLCCTYGGTHFIGYIKEAKQGEYMAVSGDSDYKTVYEIVAWMPKPETYKGVDA